MAFLKYAKANLQKPGIKFAEWDAVRSKAVSPEPDFQKRTAKIILQEYDPSKYMLSHATIVASVDVDNAPTQLGRHFVDGFEIDRQFNDYYITPATSGYVNNNNDSFERKLLLATFKTFIGAHSYVEHVQLPELSKGRIIDAAARDIGDSIYIDILIANDLRHAPLIRAIKSGQMGTLSMGCSTSSTICSKCGNVAKDETQLCGCIRFFKGQEFIDELGNRRKIAELCGHYTEPESVRFIEASWVGNPAFKGAVIRNILSAEEVAQVGSKLHIAMNREAPQPIEGALAKAAFIYTAEGQQLPPSQTESMTPAPPPAEEEKDPFDKAVEDLSKALRDKAIEHVRKEIGDRGNKKEPPAKDPNQQNESLIKSAMQNPEWRKVAKSVIKLAGQRQAKRIVHGLVLHRMGGWNQLRVAGFTGSEILAVSRILDVMTKKASFAGETRVYRTVLSVGGTAPYEDDETYLAACRRVLGRVVTGNEASMLLEKGRLYALGRSK
jgi:hypothetical protein